jgi:NhaP-type Na+/H+ or K+/H+ antiporter
VPFASWATVVGALLIVTALTGSLLKRLPANAAMLYLAVGSALGPLGAGLLLPDPLRAPQLLEFVSEVALLISLFSIGLKLGVPLSSRRWRLPLRLAFVSMTLTVALIAAVAIVAMKLPPGAAILLGAVLAPTDPVLAGDVQVEEPEDRDRLRFSLSGEGALNDATAFPFVMLGLGLLGVHDLGPAATRWLAIDLLWTLFGGFLIGGVLGWTIAKLVIYLRTRHQEAVGLDEFLALGLVALTYGAARFAHASTFLAVFAAGLAVQRIRGHATRQAVPKVSPIGPAGPAGLQDKEAHVAVATHPELAGAYMMQAVRGFNEQLERVAELAIVLVVGAMLARTYLDSDIYWFLPLLFLVVRPLAVWLGLLGADKLFASEQRVLISWFGIRGIGSIYYLVFAIGHGLPVFLAERIAALTLATVAVSIVVHGVSVTPLMKRYAGRSPDKELS